LKYDECSNSFLFGELLNRFFRLARTGIWHTPCFPEDIFSNENDTFWLALIEGI
jgi:hypothetical protein